MIINDHFRKPYLGVDVFNNFKFIMLILVVYIAIFNRLGQHLTLYNQNTLS